VEPNPRGQGNETRECVLDLAATSNLFRAGHRIALHVTWSSFPRWLPLSRSSGGEPRVVGYEIFHDSQRPSYLELPVLGADTISTMNRPGSR
jgi:predicted acyl esterase